MSRDADFGQQVAVRVAVQGDVLQRAGVLHRLEMGDDACPGNSLTDRSLDVLEQLVPLANRPLTGDQDVDLHERAASRPPRTQRVKVDAVGAKSVENGSDVRE